MTRMILAIVLGGLVVTIWGFISWVVLPFHNMSLHTLPGEPAEVDAFLSRVDAHGVYRYPGFPHHEDGTPVSKEEWNEAEERMRRGPVVSMMVVHPDGAEPFPIQNLLGGLVLNMVGAGLLVLLVRPMRRAGAPFGACMGIVFVFALFAVVAAVLPGWIWWGFPALFGTLGVVDVLVSWLLAGLVIVPLMRNP